MAIILPNAFARVDIFETDLSIADHTHSSYGPLINTRAKTCSEIKNSLPNLNSILILDGTYGIDPEYNWEQSMDYVRSYTYKGITGWRLATLKEVEILQQCVRRDIRRSSSISIYTASRERVTLLHYENNNPQFRVSSNINEAVTGLLFVKGGNSADYSNNDNIITGSRNRATALQQSQENEYQQKTIKFRKSVSAGDDTTLGVVIEIKGNLVKIQRDERQCSQKNYKDECINWINTSAEKWFKRADIYPPR